MRRRSRVAASNSPGARYTAAPRMSPRIEMTRNARSSPSMAATITLPMVNDPPDVSFRPGHPGDLAALLDLIARCDQTMSEWAPAGFEPSPAEVEEDKLAARLADP